MNERIERNASSYEYGCVLLELNLFGWKKITSFIDPEDLYEPNDGRHGVEVDPHVTLKFGLEGSVSPNQIEEILSKNPITEKIHIDKIDLFKNNEFEVVKFKVTPNEQLLKVYEELSKLPNHDKFLSYDPHITIAFVKKGTGEKYINDSFNGWATPYQIIYSKPDGSKFYF